jgi:pilus assembly protein TadC
MINNKMSLFILIYLCTSMSLVVFFLSILGRLLGSWLAWDMNNKFPFSFEDVFIGLKVSLVGLPVGFLLWFFYYRDI